MTFNSILNLIGRNRMVISGFERESNSLKFKNGIFCRFTDAFEC